MEYTVLVKIHIAMAIIKFSLWVPALVDGSSICCYNLDSPPLGLIQMLYSWLCALWYDSGETRCSSHSDLTTASHHIRT
jgi:hypothetical protein